ncbi:MAG: phosphatase PAP2 family protein [Kiritimatiellae bacterium]|nr:phosphatase PAP2 family protein [Kiritimatiellia bacterium]MDD5521573.1 phosphatase PAP2 family protein [Kiritimatiellia bacterium]
MSHNLVAGYIRHLFLVFAIALNLTLSVFAEEPIPHGGDILQVVVPASGYLTTFFLDDDEGRDQFYESALLSLGITYGLKYTFDTKRPNGGHHSFPSGHTSAAFMGAAFISERYGWEYGIPAYLAAAYTGWSRVENQAHHPQDVFAGAAIGILSSHIFTTRFKNGIVLQPFVDDDAVGLQLSFTW